MKKIYLSIAILFSLAMGSNAQNANTSLSNLSFPTKINHTLLPKITSFVNLGSSTKKWKNLFLSGTLNTDSIKGGRNGINVAGGLNIQNFLNVGTDLNVYNSINVIYGGIIVGQGTISTTFKDEDNSENNSAGYLGRPRIGVYGVGPSGVVGSGEGDSGVGVVGGGAWIGVHGTGDNYAGVCGKSFDNYGGIFTPENGRGLKAETVNGDYAGAFYGAVWTSAGSYLPSDKNFKKDVKDFTGAMNIINKLVPKYYQYTDDTKYASIHLPKGNHYGLIAQDLELVLPGLVKESVHTVENRNTTIEQFANRKLPSAEAPDEQKLSAASSKESITIKAVNYTELIPIMIKGMQELSAKNENLQSQVNELKSLLVKNGYTTSTIPANGYLKQNVPNPASSNTVINYNLPANTGRAQIRITDEKGSVLKVYNASTGEGLVNIRMGELPAGTYTYALYLNDKKIDAKQMVITK